MFKLRREQMDAFRPLVWSQLRTRFALALEKAGATVVHRPGHLTVQDHKYGTSQFFFRSDGLVAGLKSPQGTQYDFDHDSEGRLACIRYSNGDSLGLAYDDKSRLQLLTRSGISTHQFEYDDEGHIITVTHPDGSISRRIYHSEGRLSSSWDREGARTKYERDDAGDLLATIDPLERATLYAYGPEGRLSAIQFPDGTRESHEYQATNRRVMVRHPGGEESEISFNAEGGLRFFRRGDLTNEFDDKGRLIKAINSEGAVEMVFDGYDRLVQEVTPFGSIERGYADDGRLTSLSHDLRGRIEFLYDEECRLTRVADWDGRETTFSYEPKSNSIKLRHPNGLQERRTFTSFGRLVEAAVSDERGQTLSRQAYGYDICGRLTKAMDSWGQLPGQSREYLFNYDREGRLVSSVDSNSRRTISAFVYDAKGNLVQDNGVSIAVGAMDQPARYGRAIIDYAPSGGMLNPPSTGTDSRRCEYGPIEFLQAVTIGTRRIYFGYDALGRRLWKREGKKITRYGWAASNLIWEQVQDESGHETWRDYLYLPGSVAPLCFRQNGQVFWCECDARNAICRVFDEQRHLVWRAIYEPFGKAEVVVASVKQPWRLLGHYEDEETGLYYNLARYYCPDTKSYLSRDPSWYKPYAQNYGYARNSPWNYVDPFGALTRPVAEYPVAGPESPPVKPPPARLVVNNAVLEEGSLEVGAETATIDGAGVAVGEGTGVVLGPVGWGILVIIGVVVSIDVYLSTRPATQTQARMECEEEIEEPADPVTGVASGRPAARVGDPHVCPMSDGPKPHVGGPILPTGCPTVLIGGMPAARVGDRLTCASVPDVIAPPGAPKVLIGGLPAARMFDKTLHGGKITAGDPSVLIGGPSSDAPPCMSDAKAAGAAGIRH
jgi:RHS repeat-associated protein